jgi:hypothetical protein
MLPGYASPRCRCGSLLFVRAAGERRAPHLAFITSSDHLPLGSKMIQQPGPIYGILHIFPSWSENGEQIHHTFPRTKCAPMAVVRSSDGSAICIVPPLGDEPILPFPVHCSDCGSPLTAHIISLFKISLRLGPL